MKSGQETEQLMVFPWHDSGFGIIEVVISLLLISVLSVSFIPLLWNSLSNAAANTTIVTATQIVNQEIEGARAVRSPLGTTPSCLDVMQFLQITLATVVDPRGVVLQPLWSNTSCPSLYPGVVRAGISVTKVGQVTPVAQAATYIFVKMAS